MCGNKKSKFVVSGNFVHEVKILLYCKLIEFIVNGFEPMPSDIMEEIIITVNTIRQF